MVSRATFTHSLAGFVYVRGLTKTPCLYQTKTRSFAPPPHHAIDQTNVFQCIQISHKLYGSAVNPIKTMQIEN